MNKQKNKIWRITQDIKTKTPSQENSMKPSRHSITKKGQVRNTRNWAVWKSQAHMETCLWLNYMAATSLLRSNKVTAGKKTLEMRSSLKNIKIHDSPPIPYFLIPCFLQHGDKHTQRYNGEASSGLPFQNPTSIRSAGVSSQHWEGHSGSGSHYSSRQLRLGAGTQPVHSQSATALPAPTAGFSTTAERTTQKKCKSVPSNLKVFLLRRSLFKIHTSKCS